MYIVLSVIFCLVSFFLFKKAAGSMKMNELNMISFVFYFHLVLQIYIGSVIVLYGVETNSVVSAIKHSETKYVVWLYISYMMIAMPLGMILVNVLSNSQPKRLFRRYLSSGVVLDDRLTDSVTLMGLYFLMLLSVISTLIIFFKINQFPLIQLFSARDQYELLYVRTSIEYGIGWGVYFKNLFGIYLSPILTYILFSYWKKTKSNMHFIFFSLMFLNTFLLLTMDLKKSPFIWFLIGFLFLNILTNGAVRKRTIVLISAFFFVVLLVVFIVITKNMSLDFLLSYNSGLTGRIILSQVSGLYHFFEVYPDSQQHLGVSSLSNLVSYMFNIEFNSRAAREVMVLSFPERVEEGVAGVMNSNFIGEAWANFGYIGVLASPLYIGILIQVMYLFFMRSKKSPVMLGLFSFFTVKSSLNGGFNDYIYNPYLMLTIFIFLSLVLFSNSYKKNYVVEMKYD